MTEPRYCSSVEEAVSLSQRIAGEGKRKKTLVYGTVLYVPPVNSVVDFGVCAYPTAWAKKEVCPRVLLVSTWTDGRWGFVGGGVNDGESAVEALNREMKEETGFSSEDPAVSVFSDADYCFSYVKKDGTPVHLFAKVSNDLDYFQSILVGFHANHSRPSYCDEVIGICGMPLWVEGPEDAALVDMGRNGCWGLPRMLVGQGGALTQGPFLKMQISLAREQLLAVLLKKGVITYEVYDRVFELSKAFTTGPALQSREELLATPGLRDALGSEEIADQYPSAKKLKI